MAIYRTSASGADIDKLPELIRKTAVLEEEQTATNEKILQLEETLLGVDELLGSGEIDV